MNVTWLRYRGGKNEGDLRTTSINEKMTFNSRWAGEAGRDPAERQGARLEAKTEEKGWHRC